MSQRSFRPYTVRPRSASFWRTYCEWVWYERGIRVPSAFEWTENVCLFSILLVSHCLYHTHSGWVTPADSKLFQCYLNDSIVVGQGNVRHSHPGRIDFLTIVTHDQERVSVQQGDMHPPKADAFQQCTRASLLAGTTSTGLQCVGHHPWICTQQHLHMLDTISLTVYLLSSSSGKSLALTNTGFVRLMSGVASWPLVIQVAIMAATHWFTTLVFYHKIQWRGVVNEEMNLRNGDPW